MDGLEAPLPPLLKPAVLRPRLASETGPASHLTMAHPHCGDRHDPVPLPLPTSPLPTSRPSSPPNTPPLASAFKASQGRTQGSSQGPSRSVSPGPSPSLKQATPKPATHKHLHLHLSSPKHRPAATVTAGRPPATALPGPASPRTPQTPPSPRTAYSGLISVTKRTAMGERAHSPAESMESTDSTSSMMDEARDAALASRGAKSPIPAPRVPSLQLTPAAPDLEPKPKSLGDALSNLANGTQSMAPSTTQSMTPSMTGSTKGSTGTPGSAGPTRPLLNRYYSLPMNPMSPSRQHFRLHNAVPHHVKETPHVAFLEDARGKFLNQYLITRVVGRGSFGMVYLAVDPQGQSYALKECSKRRLAKLNRSALMRLRRQIVTRGRGDVPTTSEVSSLIQREIAVMKKLDHPNLVTLYEVLDDPNSESLILVLEWCPEGTIMPAEEHYDGHAQPIPEQRSRLYFRDLVLGVEYLHARGVCHRDIKADNVLLGEGDVVKIADFGVSEIFDLTTETDNVLRPVGSPAYMSPELVALHVHSPTANRVHPANAPISGRRADIWAMGCTLYYMVHGRLPFEGEDIAVLYHNILTTEPDLSTCSPELADLFRGIFAKLPNERITLAEIREHPWVTQNGLDMLLPFEENVQVSDADFITEEDLVSAIEQIRHNHPGASQLDLEAVLRSLRAHHGWHGSVSSSSAPSGSRTPSFDSDSHHDTNHISQDSLKMEKLSRALEEMLKN